MADKVMIIQIILNRWQKLVPVINAADSDAITQILRKKITAFVPELSYITPDHLLMYCSSCSCGNPGLAQVLLKDILMTNRDTCIDCLRNNRFLPVSIIDATLIDDQHPIMDNKNAREVYMKKWDSQKTPNGNACDTADYWKEIIQ